MKNKRKLLSVVMTIMLLLLVGCKSNSKNTNMNELQNVNGVADLQSSIQESEEAYVEENQNDAKDEDNTVEEKAEIYKTSESQMEPPVTIEIPIYTIANDVAQTKATVANVPEDTEISPELIVDLVVSDIADKSYLIDVIDVTTENDYVVVNFSKETPPMVNISEDLEGTILDAFAFSIIDNIPDYSGVIFRAEGQAYISDNYTFDKNQVYLSR